MKSFHVLVVGLGVLWSMCSEARAEEADLEAARAAFQRGIALVETERWEPAVAEFQASLRHHPTQSALFNLARCYRLLGRHPEALSAYEQYMERVPRMNFILGIIRALRRKRA